MPCESDFLGSFADGDQHDVHDPIPPTRGDSANGSEHQGQPSGDGSHDAEGILLGSDGEVVVPQDPMPLPQQIGDLEFGRTGAGLITRFDADETEADAIGGIASRQPRHHRAEGM